MSTFAERLKLYIDLRGSSPAKLARAAGIKAPSMTAWLDNSTKPENVKAAPLLRAAAHLHVDPHWLITGRGRPEPAAGAAAEPAPPRYGGPAWPFEAIDFELVAKLTPREIIQIEGAWLLAARQLGFSLGKRAAA